MFAYQLTLLVVLLKWESACSGHTGGCKNACAEAATLAVAEQLTVLEKARDAAA